MGRTKIASLIITLTLMSFDLIAAIRYEWVKDIYFSPHIKQTCTMFKDAFLDIYDKYSLEDLGKTDFSSKEEWLTRTFIDEVNDINEKDSMSGLVAFEDEKNDNDVIGFMSFERYDKDTIYIGQTAIKKAYRKSHIATSMMEKALKEKYQNIKTVKLITRKINTVTQEIINKKGFKISEFIPKGYDKKYYVGYEMNLNM